MLKFIEQLTENDKYYFDADAADRPIRFIEKFLKHSEGRFAGEPFVLLGWQKDIIRCLFGWLRRSDGLRRFRELYLLSAKGAGKTPMLSAIGLYMLLGDSEASPHVISMASSYEQANLTFGAAQAFIRESRALEKVAISKQRIVRLKFKPGKWTIISGKPNGRSGPRPSCIIADECHEWTGAAGQAFKLLTKNLFKRSQPLLMMATNAGPNRSCFAWQLHERAMKVLDGTSRDDTLLPVIYEADSSLKWDTEQAAKAANPSLGAIVSMEQIEPELIKAKENSSAQADYERLYLSRWVVGSNKWLDMNLYRQCEQAFDPSTLKHAALYVGVDLSKCDDLCAVEKIWVTPQIVYVDYSFWVPRATAAHYESKDLIPYSQWEKQGDIKLVDEPTISPAVLKEIADNIIELNKAHKVKAVCYDRTRADDCIARLESVGITCVPIAQGYSVFPGCAELERRMKERSIVFSPNAVQRFCAENVEVKYTDHGDYFPVKPNANGRYAGLKAMKIDGISALVTGLVEARKHNFPNAQKRFDGKAWLIQLPQ